MTPPLVRNADTADVEALAAILADGFYDDPPMTWSFNGVHAIRPMMRLLAQRVYMPHGFATISQDENGAAMWLPANSREPFDVLTMVLSSIILARHGGLTAVTRSMKFGDFMNKHHPDEPHYYLFAIATTQAARGKGVGGALLKDGLARADADGVGTYLENSKEQNLGFYQAHGFEVLEEVRPVEGSPPLWRMFRKPT